MPKAIGFLIGFWLLLCLSAFARQQFFDDDVSGLEYKPTNECPPCDCECESEVG